MKGPKGQYSIRRYIVNSGTEIVLGGAEKENLKTYNSEI